ncbi:methylated-DNA/protein-cysteine methyltransferase [Ammonifex degensii KC4]|uniref:methylated-DNA--[protein]-cysteine S-methyltransferase n=1 Tax=Ammonifex degensii (strain DSM 10501 / KC4) TaxID=429009 RepID=C9RAS3_AMMDK|nr:methylated-DNA--[protein]-cysteine S-methyltransferase [Ammonifex degensii]ACX51350.1 methylated-DNA/protein-cysteine methyltransferase [Ammonifex degensii KC4]
METGKKTEKRIAQKIEVPSWGEFLALWSTEGKLCKLSFPGFWQDSEGHPGCPSSGERLALALKAYFAGEQVDFSWVPLDLGAYTPFQRRVLEFARGLPYGEVVSYGDLARALGIPGGARAVGRALAANRIPIIIPCHRVVARQGLGGFSLGLDWKQKLLALEKKGFCRKRHLC